jgi:DUF971 family protein
LTAASSASVRTDARVLTSVEAGARPGPGTLQTGKRNEITALEPVGNDAVQPTFSDGHDSGIFSWDYLYFLGVKQDELWADYNARLQAAGVDRDAPMAEQAGHACGSHSH